MADQAASHPANPVSPEMLVQRFGEYLVDNKLIQPDELQLALDYQQREAPKRHLLLGQALVELGYLDRETLDQAITHKLAGLQSALIQANQQLEERVQERTQDLERRLIQIRTAAEITQLALSASSLSELFRRTVELLEARFGYVYAAIFLVDEGGQVATLHEALGRLGKELKGSGLKISAGDPSLIGWVLEHKQGRVIQDINLETTFTQDKRPSAARSEAALPIAIGERLLGVLDVQHDRVDAFDADVVAGLQTIANQISAVSQNYHLLETTQNSLDQVSALYQVSYQMARANTSDEVLRTAAAALKQSNLLAALFVTEPNGLRKVALREPGLTGWGVTGKPVLMPERLAIPPSEQDRLFKPGQANILADIPMNPGTSEIPEVLIAPLRKAGYKKLALIPSRRAGKLEMTYLLAVREATALTQNILQSYSSLAELTTTALDKVYAAQHLEKRLMALQSLNAISQVVSAETDLMGLYQVIHREVVNVMGEVTFAIATYDAQADTISIPYLFEGKQVRQVESFPAGEGLTSILIRTRQPLMLVEDTERKTRELGAKIVGQPAKSWLGVPLLIAGEPIGAIILQDLEHEKRFDEDDQRLLTTLASQVAVAMRNARMLEATSRQAERQKRLYEVTNKIRNAPDVASIMQLTVQELCQLSGARRGMLNLITPVDEPQGRPEQTPGKASQQA